VRTVVGLVVGATLVAVAWWQVAAAGAGLDPGSVDDGPPVALMMPDAAEPVPGVVVVHGLAGSGRLMSSWGTALARAGYAVALPDLTGHGANPRRLGGTDTRRVMVDEVVAAAEALASRPEVDAERLALIGHSMGAGAVMQAGIVRPDLVRAVVAVSPTDADVDEDLPPDLLLLAGALEPRFVANARDLLDRAGGARGEPGDGDARALVIVPRVEHVAIVFSPTAHRASGRWLGAALDHDAGGVPPVTPIVWWAAHLVGVVVLWRTLLPARARQTVGPDGRVPALRVVVGLLGGGAVATVVVALTAPVQFGGMLVAPGVAAWFLLAGVAWMAAGARPGRPTASDLALAGLVLTVFAAAFGVLGHRVWLPWPLPAARVGAAAVLTVLIAPWTVAFATSLRGRRRAMGLAWWLIVSVGVLLGLGSAALVAPGLGFLVVLLPALPALLGLAHLVWAPLERPWAAGPATAGLIGWTLATIMPLA